MITHVSIFILVINLVLFLTMCFEGISTHNRGPVKYSGIT